MAISLPPPPALEPDTPDPSVATNTLALILPNQALFAPEALALLRDVFSSYGHVVHWAPVRGFGRVIVVYDTDEAAAAAKLDADRTWLDVDLPEDENDKDARAAKAAQSTTSDEKGYFTHSRKSSRKGIMLRVFSLPRTDLNVQDVHLRPPEPERNFLISPPGSPPEGWEPITEEGPNAAPLADDLRRALEALQLAGRGHGAGHGREVILDEGGVRVEVEDTSDGEGGAEEWGAEEVQAGPGIWVVPSQDRGDGGGGAAFKPSAFPKANVSIMPTPRPPTA